jgi:mono/diheme cytochrome c family protein
MMRSRVSMGLAALLSGMLVAAVSAQPPAGAAPSGNADAGRRLFVVKSCYLCHGTEGQGGVPYPRIARIQRGQENFIRYVRRPVRMAAYSEAVISDAELADIYAFLRAVPAPPPVAELPLLQQLRRTP